MSVETAVEEECEVCEAMWDAAEAADSRLQATARKLVDVRAMLSKLGDERELVGDQAYHDVYRAVSAALTETGLPLWAADELARGRSAREVG